MIAVLFGGTTMLVAGCGDSGENEVVGGVTEDFVQEVEQSRAGYGESMAEANKGGPGN